MNFGPSNDETNARSRIVSVTLALLVVAASFVAPVGATSHGGAATHDANVTATESVSANTAVTTISGCRNAPIDAPGTYKLTADVANSNEKYCLNITADDVTLNGMGHTIQGVGAGSDTAADAPVGIYVTGKRVAIENVTIDHWQTGVEFQNASAHIVNASITDIDLDGVRTHNSTVELNDCFVTADDDGLQASNSDLTVFTSRITNANDTHLQRGVRANDHTYFVITKSTIEGAAITGIIVNTFSEGYVWNNRILNSEIGVKFSSYSYSNTFSDNLIRGSDANAVHLEFDSNVTEFENNTIADAGKHGLYLEDSYANVTKSNFVGVGDSAVVLSSNASAAKTQVHGTVFTNVTNYGVSNRNTSAVVDATHNFWGAPSGPSSDNSNANAPFADPRTGASAKGTGAMVSEGPKAGVSNVHFDPYASSPQSVSVPAPTTTTTTTTSSPTSAPTSSTTSAPTSSTTSAPTSSATTSAPTTSNPTAGTSDDTDSSSESSTPGFTGALALVALLAFALLAGRRRED